MYLSGKMNSIAFDIILDIVNTTFPEIRKQKASNKDVLEEVISLLRSGQPWRSLRPIKHCSHLQSTDASVFGQMQAFLNSLGKHFWVCIQRRS